MTNEKLRDRGLLGSFEDERTSLNEAERTATGLLGGTGYENPNGDRRTLSGSERGAHGLLGGLEEKEPLRNFERTTMGLLGNIDYEDQIGLESGIEYGSILGNGGLNPCEKEGGKRR